MLSVRGLGEIVSSPGAHINNKAHKTMEKTRRLIMVHPDKVSVYTIGPIGDGSGDTIEQYPGSYVRYTYDEVCVIKDERWSPNSVVARYPTEEIVTIVTSKDAG